MTKILALPLLLLAAVFNVQAQQAPVRGLIVTLKPTTENARETPQSARDRMQAVAREAGVAMQDGRAVSPRLQLLKLPDAQQGEALESTMRRLRLHPDVAAVEPDVRIKRRAIPNDPGYVNQWNLQAPSTTFASAINMPPAWDLTTGSATTVVAVLDVGVRLSPPRSGGQAATRLRLRQRVEYSNDGNGRDSNPDDPGDWVSAADKRNSPALFGTCDVEDSSWHGTFIAGQIAAATNNATGIAGINWQAKILPVRIAGKCGALLSDILDGIRWAAGLPVDGVPNNPTPARVLNFSFGGDAACTSAYQTAIDEAAAAGALLVAAAGNETGPPTRPADCNGVLAVGAVQENGLKTTYSNYGAKVGISAPGGTADRGLYSLDNTGTTVPATDTYGSKAGTSFSTPQAAAVASLMLAVNPTLTPQQLIDKIKSSARPHVVVASANSCEVTPWFACNCTTATCGAGLLDARAAVVAAAPGSLPTASIVPVSQPAAGSTITLNGSASVAGTGATLTSYQWTQVSGTTVAIQNANTAQAAITLPAAAGTFVFKLVVTDSSGRSDDEQVSVTSVQAASGGSSGGESSGGGGGGASSWLWGVALWLLAGLAWWGRRSRRA